jgi:hypothetical protein
MSKNVDKKGNDVALRETNTNSLVNLDAITVLASQVKTSPFAKDFRDEDGNVDEGAIIANMVLGHEMGLAPMASLMLGKKLNANSYFSVLRGKELGLDPVTSISKVYNIPTSNGSVIALAVDIIIAKILESGTSFSYIRDNKPTPMYKTLNGQYIGHRYIVFNDDGNLDDSFFLYIKGVTSTEDLTNAKNTGKTIIYESGITHVSSVRFIRKSNNIDIVVHYSIQEAIDAGLYNGFHSSLKAQNGKDPLWIKGKANWNAHPATHLRHRPLSIGGRIVVADKLLGSYSVEEVIEIIDSETVQNEEDLVDYVYNHDKPTVEITEDKKEDN